MNTMLRLRGDGDTTWRSIGVANAGTDLLFEKASVDGSGSPLKVADGDVIRCVAAVVMMHVPCAPCDAHPVLNVGNEQAHRVCWPWG